MGKRKTKLNPHIAYIWSNKPLPSVTQIAHHTPVPELFKWYWSQGRNGLPFNAELDRTAEIGKLVHAMVNAYFDLSVVVEIEPYPLDSVRIAEKIVERLIPVVREFGEPVRLEVPIVCPKYGGTPDGIFKLGGQLLLVDYKTSSRVVPEHYVQLAGYLDILSRNHKTYVGGSWVPSRPLTPSRFFIIHAPRSGKIVNTVEVDGSLIKEAARVFRVRYLAYILDRVFKKKIGGD